MVVVKLDAAPWAVLNVEVEDCCGFPHSLGLHDQ